MEIGDVLLIPSFILRTGSTTSLTDPRILAKIRAPLVGLRVPWISREPVDGVVHVVPVIDLGKEGLTGGGFPLNKLVPTKTTEGKADATGSQK